MGQPLSQIAKRLWALAKEGGHSSPEAAGRFDVPSPSQHERLEAWLNLREWLKNKLSASEIDSLLGC